MPLVVIVPADVVPPVTPSTLQVTSVLEVLVTVAVKACELPSRTDPVIGVTVTVIEGGGGGGGGPELAPPPQPRRHAHTGKDCGIRNERISLRTVVEMRPVDFLRICERGDRMPARMQAKGQRKVKKGYELPETEAPTASPRK